MAIPPARTARRVIREVSAFIREYDPPLDHVEFDRQPVIHMLWGWLVWMSEQSLVVSQAKDPRRIAAVSPLVRSVGEHADVMLWLSEIGSPGIAALHAQAQLHQRRLWDSYESAEGHGPPGIERPMPPNPPATEEEENARRLLKSVEQRSGAFEGGVPYYVFRLLSGVVHAGLGTSRVYAPVTDDGTGQMLNVPSPPAIHGLRDSAPIDCAVRCCQAGLIVARELKDPHLDDQLRLWLAALGLDEALPRFVQRIVPRTSEEEVRDLARQLLEGEWRDAEHGLQSLVSETHPPNVETSRLAAELRQLRRAITNLARITRRTGPRAEPPS